MTELGKTNEHVSVDYRNDAVETAFRQRLLDVEHQRFRFRKASRLNDDDFRRNLLDDLVHSSLEFAEQRTANAAAAQLSDPHVLAFDDFRVDGDLAEFVHHNGNLRRVCGEDVPEQRRLAAAQRAGDERDGSA